LIHAAPDNGRGLHLLLGLPAILPVLPMPVRTVPLVRIKAKKIPIVQPNLTFGSEKNRQKKFIDIFQ
jgi:hypothetical protein